MRCIKLATSVSLIALVSGCASTTQYGPKARAIDYEEASAFERSLQASTPPAPQEPIKLYTQPVNKKEPCKLPTTQDQLEHSNFRAYWDGQCKNGYAFGLGRDIAISDMHHVEEITRHDGTGEMSSSPRIDYDFVNKIIAYVTPGGRYPSSSWFSEQVQISETNFFVKYTLGVTDESGHTLATEYSPLSPLRVYINDRRNVIYKFSDNSAMPAINASAVTFTAEIIDPNTKVPGGVVIVRHANGQVRHLKISGASPEAVTLPTEYVSNLTDKLGRIKNLMSSTQSNVDFARQMEREYLYMACNGRHVIDGLDSNTATKICSWRSQFKELYEKSLEKYTQNMEQLKKQAETAAQQRLAQQQLDVQQRQLQQQQTQQELQQIANALGQFGQQMQSSGQNMLNGAVNQPTPQVNFSPLIPQGKNRITCFNSGQFTNCRY